MLFSLLYLKNRLRICKIQPNNLKCLFSSQSLKNASILKYKPQPNLSYSNLARNEPNLVKTNSGQENDKLLFYYENPKFYYMLNGFAFVNFIFWVQMSEFAYKTMQNVEFPKTDKLPWWEKLDFKDKTTRTIVSTICFSLGYGILATAWLYTLRSVRMLVLRKGGDTVSIVTYTPLGGKRTLDISLDKITTNQTRQTAKVQLPIKVQGKWFYYILDTKNGVFQNPQLFDYTAGMNRVFKK